MNEFPIATFAAHLCLGFIGLAAALAFYRLLRGPSLPDRVVCLDFLATVVVGVIGVQTVLTGQVVYLRIATVVALISFLGTIAFAHYIERRGEP